MPTIQDAWREVSDVLYSLVSEPNFLYAVYLIAFLFGLFALYRGLLQFVFAKQSHLKGRPANVIAFCITVITTGAVFYGKNQTQLIELFNGFLGLIALLIISGGIGFGVYVAIKKLEMKALKFLIGSAGAFLITSLLMPQLQDAFNLTQSSSGAAAVFYGVLGFINSLSMFLMLISLIWFIFSLLSHGAGAIGKGYSDSIDKKDAKNLDLKDIKNILAGVVQSNQKLDSLFKYSSDFLERKRRTLD